jgi:nucleoside-diphosphate-sugar epimerase
MSSLFFIGGTGFLGQSFFEYLNKSKFTGIKFSKIIVLSRKRKKIKSKIKTIFLKKNLVDIKKIPVTDYIIYASNSNIYSENLRGINNFKNLLNEKHKKTKIIFISSGAVYGPRKFKKKFLEEDKVSLDNVQKFEGYKKKYAKSKIIIENQFKNINELGFKISIARLFTFIGPKILKNKNFAIGNLLFQAKNSKFKEILLNDYSDVFRGYMHADDLIGLLIKIMKFSSRKLKIYNVGSDETISIKDLAKKIGIKFNKQIKYKKKNKSNIDFYVPSISKAKKDLSFNLKYDLNKSFEELV